MENIYVDVRKLRVNLFYCQGFSTESPLHLPCISHVNSMNFVLNQIIKP